MITTRDIDRSVSLITGISEADIHSTSQKEKVKDARNLAMLKCKEHFKLSDRKLCKIYGKSSRSTIMNAIKNAKNLIETDAQARDRALRIENLIQERKIELETKRLYNLHYRIRQKGFHLDTQSKTVSIRPDQEDILRKGQLLKLIKEHGYNVQYAII